jgi:hypothetical protein
MRTHSNGSTRRSTVDNVKLRGRALPQRLWPALLGPAKPPQAPGSFRHLDHPSINLSSNVLKSRAPTAAYALSANAALTRATECPIFDLHRERTLALDRALVAVVRERILAMKRWRSRLPECQIVRGPRGSAESCK